MNSKRFNHVQLWPYEAPLTSAIETRQENNFMDSDLSATAENFVVDNEENDQWF